MNGAFTVQNIVESIQTEPVKVTPRRSEEL